MPSFAIGQYDEQADCLPAGRVKHAPFQLPPDALTWTQQREAGATGALDLLAIAIG